MEFARTVAEACGSRHVSMTGGLNEDLDSVSKQVISVHLPTISGEGQWRKEVVAAHRKLPSRDTRLGA